MATRAAPPRVRALARGPGIFPIAQEFWACRQVFGDAVGTGAGQGVSDTPVPVPSAGPLQLAAGEHAVHPDGAGLAEH